MNNSTLNQLAVQEKTRREILHKSELIPPLPDLVVRLLAVLNKPDTEPEDLERLMQNDQVADVQLGDGVFGKGLNEVVKNNDMNYPPEWRLSRSGRKKP